MGEIKEVNIVWNQAWILEWAKDKYFIDENFQKEVENLKKEYKTAIFFSISQQEVVSYDKNLALNYNKKNSN